MDKIKSFRITQLKTSGFKTFSEERTFDFGNMNSITGHNAQGKTTIAEAITYAITGAPYFGGEKSLDRLYTTYTQNLRVALTIDADGENHELMRERVKGTTTITYDGVQIKQSDLNVMFGERDVFLSVFNPLYFVEVLEDKGRSLLERYLPAIPQEQIYERLSKSQRKLLEDAKMTAPEPFLEKLRAEIRELSEEIIYAEGQRDLLKNQALDHKELIKQKLEEYEILSAEVGDTEMPDIAEIKAQLDMKTKQYRQESAVYKALRPGISCPTCKREVTAEALPEIQKSYADSISAITAEGKALTAKLKVLEAQQEARDKLAALYAEIENLYAQSAQNPEEKEKDIERLRQLVSDKKKLEGAARAYISERIELTFGGFDMLQRVSLQLYNVVKSTGEVKNVFKIAYDGRPYNYLSYSEKVKAGLEISELIKQLTDSDYPVFIDNGESVPVIDNIRPTGQVFISQVVKRAPLEVKILDAQAQKAAA